jgi:hypothetical protein
MPTLIDGLFMGLVCAAMLCALVAALSSLRLMAVVKRLLAALKYEAPEVHARLYDPFWRHDINPSNLSAFLKSDEVDDVADVHQLKNQCRSLWRWHIKSILGFVGCIALGVLVRVLAQSLGLTALQSTM